MVNEGTQTRGRVTVRLYESSEAQTYEQAQQAEPLREDTISNTTCVGLHEWIVDALNGASPIPPEPSELAVGRSTTSPSESDTGLNDEVARIDLTSFTDERDTLRMVTFIGEAEANVDVGSGETLSEVGMYAGDYFLNHSLLPINYEKDATKTMTIEVALIFDAK